MEPCPYCGNSHGELTMCFEMIEAFKKAEQTLWLHPLPRFEEKMENRNVET